MLFVSRASAFRILASAQTLGAKFEAKAIGADGLLLRQHIDTVLHLRDLFDKAGRAYREAHACTTDGSMPGTDSGTGASDRMCT